jgi:aminoglycoside 3-N-acetyltransferase
VTDCTSEAAAIARSDRPATVGSLVADLARLGVEPGATLIVHSSLSALGWVAGGAQAVVEALLAAVGPDGTIVMPTHSGQLTDPAGWSRPPVPESWIDAVRAGMPAYDPQLSPTRAMGQIVECFRHHPGTVRSAHPTLSFAACGVHAHDLVDDHPLAPALGDASPLGRAYALGAQVLLLGVGHDNDTSLHLAEHRAAWPGRAEVAEGAPLLVDGERQWVNYHDLDYDSSDFALIGEALHAAHPGLERVGVVGAGTARLVDQRALVDFAAAWLCDHRGRS